MDQTTPINETCQTCGAELRVIVCCNCQDVDEDMMSAHYEQEVQIEAVYKQAMVGDKVFFPRG